MTRCKVGDLAMTFGMLFPENNGRLVSVLRIADERLDNFRCVLGDITFMCLSLGTPLITNSDAGFKLGSAMERPISIRCLRPINDPDDTAQDESLSWLKVPGGEVVA